ncbi:MAG: hypothetical protein R3E52_02950 [Burkholderiaceae bacterium]
MFHINEHPTEADRPAIVGRFKSTHNATDLVADRQAATFFALLKLADLSPGKRGVPVKAEAEAEQEPAAKEPKADVPAARGCAEFCVNGQSTAGASQLS